MSCATKLLWNFNNRAKSKKTLETSYVRTHKFSVADSVTQSSGSSALNHTQLKFSRFWFYLVGYDVQNSEQSTTENEKRILWAHSIQKPRQLQPNLTGLRRCNRWGNIDSQNQNWEGKFVNKLCGDLHWFSFGTEHLSRSSQVTAQTFRAVGYLFENIPTETKVFASVALVFPRIKRLTNLIFVENARMMSRTDTNADLGPVNLKIAQIQNFYNGFSNSKYMSVCRRKNSMLDFQNILARFLVLTRTAKKFWCEKKMRIGPVIQTKAFCLGPKWLDNVIKWPLYTSCCNKTETVLQQLL